MTHRYEANIDRDDNGCLDIILSATYMELKSTGSGRKIDSIVIEYTELDRINEYVSRFKEAQRVMEKPQAGAITQVSDEQLNSMTNRMS